MAGVTEQVVLQWIAAVTILIIELQTTVLKGGRVFHENKADCKSNVKPRSTQSPKGASCRQLLSGERASGYLPPWSSANSMAGTEMKLQKNIHQASQTEDPKKMANYQRVVFMDYRLR